MQNSIHYVVKRKSDLHQPSKIEDQNVFIKSESLLSV